MPNFRNIFGNIERQMKGMESSMGKDFGGFGKMNFGGDRGDSQSWSSSTFQSKDNNGDVTQKSSKKSSKKSCKNGQCKTVTCQNGQCTETVDDQPKKKQGLT